MTKFENLGLNPIIIKTVEKMGFDKPTQIQQEAIPLVLDGHDVMGLAQTGTGKTAAFGLPLVDHLLKLRKKPAAKSVHALVLVPTRELANQIDENLRRYVYGTSLKVNVVVGGAKIHTQQRKLERGTDVLIATPGRLLDLVKRRSLNLEAAQFLVLDEADQMLDLGFIHALRQIAPLLAKPRQTLLFSATMPKQMEELSRSYLNDPVRVETAPAGRAADKVKQKVYQVEQRAKSDLLVRCLSERPNDYSIVFARTKHGAEKLKNRLCDMGFSAVSVHGNKSQGQRERAIREFKSYKSNIMVATDVAARGIDIPGVSHVYNYDLPEVAENYVHRIGRTARAGNEGLAIAFCSSRERNLLRGVERLMKLKIEEANANDLPAMPRFKKAKSEDSGDYHKKPERAVKFKDERREKGEKREKHKAYKDQKDLPQNPRKKKRFNDENRTEFHADYLADHLMEDQQEEAPKAQKTAAKKPFDNQGKKPRWSTSKKQAKRKLEASRTKSKKHAERRHSRDSEKWQEERSSEADSAKFTPRHKRDGARAENPRGNDTRKPRQFKGAANANGAKRGNGSKEGYLTRGKGSKPTQGQRPRRKSA